nr:uncharacterized protein LOC101033107 [Saimiri boliviensis boliviensis]
MLEKKPRRKRAAVVAPSRPVVPGRRYRRRRGTRRLGPLPGLPSPRLPTSSGGGSGADRGSGGGARAGAEAAADSAIPQPATGAHRCRDKDAKDSANTGEAESTTSLDVK